MQNERLKIQSDTQSGLFITQIGGGVAENFAARIYFNAKSATAASLSQIKGTHFTPVGSVDFCKEAMLIQGIQFPNFSTYPSALRTYFGRNISATNVGVIRETQQSIFVKPISTKLFTGFIWPQDGEDKEALLSLPDCTMLWCSDVVNFVSEWRYYICNGFILGYGRYDDGDDNAPVPDINIVKSAVIDFENGDAPAGYGLDFGVLDTGETVLVEANDGWALGLYKDSCPPRDYIRLLESRWKELRTTAVNN
jgi:hypothetical protein